MLASTAVLMTILLRTTPCTFWGTFWGLLYGNTRNAEKSDPRATSCTKRQATIMSMFVSVLTLILLLAYLYILLCIYKYTYVYTYVKIHI